MDVAIVAPAPAARARSLFLLFEELDRAWSQEVGTRLSEYHLTLCERIAALLPRLDRPGEFGFPVRSIEDFLQVRDLFLCQVRDGEITFKPQILEIHEYKPIPRPKKRRENSKDILPEDIPVPSSGTQWIDTLAGLIFIDKTVEGAIELWERLDYKNLDALMYRYNELARDPQERHAEFLQERLEESVRVEFPNAVVLP